MALVQTPRLRVSLTFRDNNYKSADMSLYLPPDTTVEDAAAFLAGLRTAVLPLTNAALVNAAVLITYDEDAPIDPPNESEVERKLITPLRTAIRGVNSRIELPSPVFSIEQDGTDVIPESSAAYAAFVNYLINGPLGVGNGPVTIAGVPITRAEQGYVKHRTRAEKR